MRMLRDKSRRPPWNQPSSWRPGVRPAHSLSGTTAAAALLDTVQRLRKDRPMPLFGGRKEQNDRLAAEVDRLAALPLAELGAEVMTKGFGPGAPAGDGKYAALSTVAGALNPAEGSFLDDDL